MDIWTGCNQHMHHGPVHMPFDAIYPDGPLVLLCYRCSTELFPGERMEIDAEPRSCEY